MSCWRAWCGSSPQAQIAVVAMDPTRRRSGGALLGDRIRMNSLAAESVFMRSLATRRAHLATSAVLKDVIELYKAAGFDLVIVETAGIGQSDTEIVDLVDLSLYVMTSEYGAASQLEKIDMLDFADFIVLNKSEKRGAEDSLRDVRKQWRRNHPQRGAAARRASCPVFPTIASRFNDPGVNRLFAAVCAALDDEADRQRVIGAWRTRARRRSPRARRSCPARARAIWRRSRRAAARRVRASRRRSQAARRAYGLYESLKSLHDAALPGPLERYPDEALAGWGRGRHAPRSCAPATTGRSMRSAPRAVAELKAWPARARSATEQTYTYKVRERRCSRARTTPRACRARRCRSSRCRA